MPGNQPADKLTRAAMCVDTITGHTLKYIRHRYGCEACPIPPMPACATTSNCTQSTLCSELIIHEQLYDLDLDPNELCNRITDVGYCTQLLQLRGDLEALSGP